MAKITKSNLSSLREKYGTPDTTYIPTGNPVLDELWNGGLPMGKIIELHSESGLGKTTVALQVSKTLLKKGIKVAFLDVESALDESLKTAMGIVEYESNKDEPLFLHLNPITFKEVEECMNYAVENDYKLIIYDSLTMTVPDKRKEGSFVDEQPGQKAKFQAMFLEQYKGELRRKGISLLIINQMRTNISFISTRVEPAGGKGLQFNTDIRTGMRRKEYICDPVDKDQKIGVVLEATTIKNKLALPFRTANMYFYFGKGVDLLETVAEMLVARDVFKQAGSYFKLPDGTNVQGRKGLFDWVRENKQKAKELLGGNYTTFTSPEVALPQVVE